MNLQINKFQEKKKLTIQSHLQFKHPLFETLKNLLRDPGLNDEELRNIKYTGSKYIKLPPKLVMGFSIAYKSNEIVSHGPKGV